SFPGGGATSPLWLPAFFFSSRRRHTRFSRDWSSDVCSSDLSNMGLWKDAVFQNGVASHAFATVIAYRRDKFPNGGPKNWAEFWEIGRASCRERGVVPVVGRGGRARRRTAPAGRGAGSAANNN